MNTSSTAVALSAALLSGVIVLSGCGPSVSPRPVESVAVELPLTGTAHTTFDRRLDAGTWLVEVREQDIDARVTVTAGAITSTLNNALPRHGAVYSLVRLESPAQVNVTVSSADHPSRTGNVSVRVLRWARTSDALAVELQSGYDQVSKAAGFAVAGTPDGWKSAAESLQASLTHFDAARDDVARADAAYSLAYVQYGPRDELADAIRNCDVAIEAYRRLGDQTGIEDASTLRAVVEIEIAATLDSTARGKDQRAMYSDADLRLNRAVDYFGKHGMPVREQYAVNMRGIRSVYLGDYEAAAALFARAAALARRNGDIREETRALANVAAVDTFLGYMSRAAKSYESLLPMIDRAAQPYEYAVALANLGFDLISLGELDRALALHLEALQIYTRLGRESERVGELSALGDLYFLMGDNERALDTVKTAMIAHERRSDFRGLSGALQLAGMIASALGRHDEALAYLRRANRVDSNPVSVDYNRVGIAGSLLNQGRLDAAERELEQPLRSSNPSVLAGAIQQRARIKAARGDRSAAIVDLRDASARYADLGLEFSRMDTVTTLSQTLLAAGDVDGAAAAADDAISIVGRIRSTSGNPEWRARFLSARYSPYEARIAAEFARESTDAPWRAFRIAEDIRARSLSDERSAVPDTSSRAEADVETGMRDRLASLQVRLEQRLRDGETGADETNGIRSDIVEARARLDAIRSRRAVASGADTLPASLPELQAVIPPKTVVLAYFVGDTEGHAWALGRNVFRHTRLPGRSFIQKTVLAAQRELRAGKVGAAGRNLGRLLLQPLLSNIDGERLMILADGPLNAVPFASLPLSANGESVAERFVSANAPSLRLALRPARYDGAAPAFSAVISDPVYSMDDRRMAAQRTVPVLRSAESSGHSLPRLTFSAVEAQSVVSALVDRKVVTLSGFDATVSRVESLPAEGLDVLHFATHASTSSDLPAQPALFLSGFATDGSRIERNRLTVDEIARSGLHAKLVVLSGCATGDGRELHGEGVLGIAYRFLANGSDSVVASLWPIEDALTARFMQDFYAAYRETGRAPDALRAAQLKARGTLSAAVGASFVVRANGMP